MATFLSVVRHRNGGGVNGARVRLSGREGTTWGGGALHIGGLAPGRYDVSVDGYGSVTPNVVSVGWFYTFTPIKVS